MPEDLGSIVQLTDRPESDGQPAFLPDGRLLYTATVGGTTELRWMDPFAPEEVFVIDTGPESARAPVALR